MTKFRTYRRIIFGKDGKLFQGVDQGFDPCSEPSGRVQFAMDADFGNQTIKLRNGYEKFLQYNSASVLGIKRITFNEEANDGLAVLLGDGTVMFNLDFSKA